MISAIGLVVATIVFYGFVAFAIYEDEQKRRERERKS